MKLIAVFIFFMSTVAHAAYTIKDGRLVDKETMPTQSVQEHYSAALEAHRTQAWPELLRQVRIVLKNFPSSPFAEEALFYSGIGYFHTEELELANEHFSSYLKLQAPPKHFEEAIELKYAIAERFQQGAKKHLFGVQFLPKWIPAKDDALELYEEVIAALPHHELSAKALFGKAQIYFQTKEYKLSVEAFQTVIRRFSKHQLAPESYVSIAEVYLTQSKDEYPDLDLLDLASINLRKFKLDFPSDERIRIAESMHLKMQEVYAKTLYETAQFFERTKKSKAAQIYYNKIINSYPETKTADRCRAKVRTVKISEADS